MLKIAFISSKLLNNFFSFFLESILQKCTVKFEEVLKLLASFIEVKKKIIIKNCFISFKLLIT